MRLQKNITIIGWGDVPTDPTKSYSNDRVLGMIEANLLREGRFDDLAKIHTLTPTLVRQKIGIKERQYHFGEETTSIDLALIAARHALTSAATNDPNFSPEKVSLIVSGGSTPKDLYPSCAAALQDQLGIPPIEAWDVSAACASGTQGLIEAARALQLGCNHYALIAVGETIGSDGTDRLDEDSLLWGDGGGAIVIRASEAANRNYGVLDFESKTDGSLRGTTRSRGIGTHADHRRFPAINASMEGQGRKIFRWVVGSVAEDLMRFLSRNRIKVDKRTFLVPHNGNLHMVQSLGKAVRIPKTRILNRIAERGNQSSASVFSTLAHFANKGFFQNGDQLIIATFGGGVIYNFIAYRWE